MKGFDPNSINLTVENVRPFLVDDIGGIVIEWSSDIGFGEYTFFKRKDRLLWAAESETMDSDEDKAFGRKLLELWMDQILIVE